MTIKIEQLTEIMVELENRKNHLEQRETFMADVSSQFVGVAIYKDVLKQLKKLVPDDEQDLFSKLQKSPRGKILNNAYNALLVFENDKNLKGKFYYDETNHYILIRGEVPWTRVNASEIFGYYDYPCLRNYLSLRYGITKKYVINDVLREVAMNQAKGAE